MLSKIMISLSCFITGLDDILERVEKVFQKEISCFANNRIHRREQEYGETAQRFSAKPPLSLACLSGRQVLSG